MSLLSDLYISSPESALSYDTTRSLPRSERAEFNGLTFEEFSRLWAILKQDQWTSEHSNEFECILEVDGGQRLIHRFPTSFVIALSRLDDKQTLEAAGMWVKTGDLAYMSCPPDAILPVISAASRLAKAAQEGNKSMYLWMCA